MLSGDGSCVGVAKLDDQKCQGYGAAHRGEPTRQEIEQSISLGRVLQRFV